MTDLNAPVWSTLHAASAHYREALEALVQGRGDFRENLELLAENLSHQLSFYDATAYALPHLAALCPTLGGEDRAYLIALMGAAIAAEAGAPLPPDGEAFREFQEGLTLLAQETRLLLKDPAVLAALAEDRALGQQFALAALALLGDRGHANILYFLSSSCWETGMAACPCGWSEEELPLTEEYIRPAAIGPWDGASLAEETVWFSGLLRRLGDEEILPILPYVCGRGVCPDCGREEPVWDWVNRWMNEC